MTSRYQMTRPWAPYADFTETNVADIEAVKLILKQPNADCSAGLIHAALGGYTEAVKLILADGRADTTEEGCMAINCAALEGYLDIVEILLREDCQHNQEHGLDGVLHSGAIGNHTEIVERMLHAGGNPAAYDYGALKMAVSHKNKEMVNMLIA